MSETELESWAETYIELAFRSPDSGKDWERTQLSEIEVGYITIEGYSQDLET